MAQAYIVQPMGSRRKSISDAVVTLDRSSWTYDGSEHCPKVTKVTLGGEQLVENVDYVYHAPLETDAGEYSVTIFGVGNYEDVVSAPWRIEKAKNTITANPSDVDIFGPIDETKQVLLNFEGDGVVTVSQSAYVTSRVDGHTLTLTSVNEGEDMLTVSVGEGTNYLSASCEVHVNVEIISSVFERNSWKTIASVCASGQAKEFWGIGDEKSFTRNGETYHFQIGGFDHDDLDPTDARYSDPTYNGGKKKAAITLIMKEVFSDKHQMHDVNSNIVSWSSSNMRTETIPQIKSEMDQDLISVVRTVTKNTGSGGGKATTIRSTADDLFLMSEIEALGRVDYSKTGEGSYYEFFQSGNSEVKFQSGTAQEYWLRSPYYNDDAHFLNVRSFDSYSASANTSKTQLGVVVCCCI